MADEKKRDKPLELETQIKTLAVEYGLTDVELRVEVHRRLLGAVADSIVEDVTKRKITSVVWGR